MKTKIYVAGHRGMVGSAIARKLQELPNVELVVRSRRELDLTDQAAVRDFFYKEKPDQVYLAAAKVGGILANNQFPAEFIYENLQIQSNVIHQAFSAGVKKLLFLGSSCIYPKLAEQPMSESQLLTGKLEPTNEPYAIAKIAGIKMCESYNRQYGVSHGIDFRSVMPTNLYGPGDNYHPLNSHVVPALLRRFHEAKLGQQAAVVIWGTGSPKREFLYVDDMADASIFVMNLEHERYSEQVDPMESHLNVGFGEDIKISELAELVRDVVGYRGKLEFDLTKPDGTPRKLMDTRRLSSLGWSAKVPLRTGIEIAYKDFMNNHQVFDGVNNG